MADKKMNCLLRTDSPCGGYNGSLQIIVSASILSPFRANINMQGKRRETEWKIIL